jgi:hypothetical protein
MNRDVRSSDESLDNALVFLLIVVLILIMRNFSKDDAGTFERLGMINNYSASW